MNRETFQLFLHVGAVVVALGATFTLPLLQLFAEQNGVAATKFMLRFSARAYRILVIPGALVVLAFGVALVLANDRGYREEMPAWLAGCTMWFILALAATFHYQPAAVREGLHALDEVRVGDQLPAGYGQAALRLRLVEGFLAFSTLAITFVMFWKPGE